MKLPNNRIIYKAHHGYFKREILTWDIPFLLERAHKGQYSRFYKRLKKSCSNDLGSEKEWLRIDVTIKYRHGDADVILSFPSGLKIVMPDNMNETDYKIIDLYLQALKLSCSA